MILTETKRFFLERRTASLSDLSIHFQMEPDAMRGILDQWISKGKLRRLPRGEPCKGCCGACGSNDAEIYQWVG